MTTPSTKTRSIEIHTDTKVILVDNIPKDAKITYGGLRPDQPGSRTNTLRIYTSQQNQLAVFRDVIWFRDMSLELTERDIKVNEWAPK